jgi:hypothetical protein
MRYKDVPSNECSDIAGKIVKSGGIIRFKHSDRNATFDFAGLLLSAKSGLFGFCGDFHDFQVTVQLVQNLLLITTNIGPHGL